MIPSVEGVVLLKKWAVDPNNWAKGLKPGAPAKVVKLWNMLGK
jgi:hypothetical protein